MRCRSGARTCGLKKRGPVCVHIPTAGADVWGRPGPDLRAGERRGLGRGAGAVATRRLVTHSVGGAFGGSRRGRGVRDQWVGPPPAGCTGVAERRAQRAGFSCLQELVALPTCSTTLLCLVTVPGSLLAAQGRLQGDVTMTMAT